MNVIVKRLKKYANDELIKDISNEADKVKSVLDRISVSEMSQDEIKKNILDSQGREKLIEELSELIDAYDGKNYKALLVK